MKHCKINCRRSAKYWYYVAGGIPVFTPLYTANRETGELETTKRPSRYAVTCCQTCADEIESRVKKTVPN